MNFCPNCGKKREEEEICVCGYNYLTEEVEKNSFNSMNKMNDLCGFVSFQGGVSLEELKRRKLDIGDLLSISYTSSGGMMGSYYNDELSFEKNEFTVVNQEWHHGEKKEIKYRVDEDKIKEIKNILIENNFRAWSEIPVDKSMIAYDAPTSSVYLRFEQKTVSFSTLIYMNQEEKEIFSELRKMINSLAIKENIISEKILTNGMMVFGLTTTSGFCPECGGPLVDGKCECGYQKNN